MFVKLLLIFIAIPFIEVLILIKLWQVLGAIGTILIQVGTALVGATLARLQGLFVWKKIQTELSQGRMPREELVDGILIFVAGVVLITPGLLTDTLGLLILFPFTRYWFKRWLRRKFDKWNQHGGSDLANRKANGSI